MLIVIQSRVVASLRAALSRNVFFCFFGLLIGASPTPSSAISASECSAGSYVCVDALPTAWEYDTGVGPNCHGPTDRYGCAIAVMNVLPPTPLADYRCEAWRLEGETGYVPLGAFAGRPDISAVEENTYYLSANTLNYERGSRLCREPRTTGRLQQRRTRSLTCPEGYLSDTGKTPYRFCYRPDVAKRDTVSGPGKVAKARPSR